MAALVRERLGSVKAATRELRPVGAAVTIYKGALLQMSAGFVIPASPGTGKRTIGRAAQTILNPGAAGAQPVDVHFLQERNVLLLANSGTNPITAAMRETVCYAEDDQTVGSLATGFSVAGIVFDVTTEGVWVEIGAKS